MSLDQPIKLLIAEGELTLSELLTSYLEGRGHKVTVARDGRTALRILRTQPFDVALLDIVMPAMDGIEVLRHLREDPTPPECIIITGNETVDTAIAAMRLGAYDYVSKPYRLAEIDVLVRRAWEKRSLASGNRLLAARLSRIDAAREFTSVYAPMQAVLAMARRIAASGAPVLITGEAGCGKSALARYIHRNSDRPDGPIVEAVCAAIAPGQGESVLFGVEHPDEGDRANGASSSGMMEIATGGSLVLDDVGQLDSGTQAALADAMARGTYRRVGSRHRIESDVRFLATTTVDRHAAVRGNAFCADLVAQFAPITIHLPPLRDRGIDIPALAQLFVREQGGAGGPTLAAEAIDALQQYSWPGNLRELRNVLERAVLLAGGGLIHAHDLPLPASVRTSPDDDAPLSLQQLERRHIAAVLQRAHWHQGKAAQLLGISAKTLYRKIREFGFERPTGVTGA